MADARNIMITHQLDEANSKYNGSDVIFGPTALTHASRVSGTRLSMYTSQLKQVVGSYDRNCYEPPLVPTGHENKTGEHSSGYLRTTRPFVIIDKITKFDTADSLYTLIIRYQDGDREYDAIESKIVEDLNEAYGYRYDTSVMDELDVGDEVDPGTILYRSYSYDDNMNYSFGANCTVAMVLMPDTAEDAIIASKTFQKKFASSEIETYRLSLNDNDVLVNLYGTTEDYRCFPEIGEFTKNKIICARRRMMNDQMLYDMKISNLKKVNFDSDTVLYGEGQLIDMTIFYNKNIDEIPDKKYNEQLVRFIERQNEYYQRIYDTCKRIDDGGYEYTEELSYIYKQAKDFVDPDVKFIEDGRSAFGNMVLEFTILKSSIVAPGQKIAGRQGNKGVISEVWDDEDMYYTKDGRRADLIMCPTAHIRRMITMTLYETTITQIIQLMKLQFRQMLLMNEPEEKILEIFYDVLGTLSKDWAKEMKLYYKDFKLSEKGKSYNTFVDYIIEKDIYVPVPVMWEDEPIYEKLKRLYDKYDWIGKEDVYIKRFGREIKVIKKMVLGEMYIIRLKQSSQIQFSARSSGSIDNKNTPAKNNNAKHGLDLHSNTPIRVGVMESINSIIGTNPDIVAKLHRYYRSSYKARNKIYTMLLRYGVVKPEYRRVNLDKYNDWRKNEKNINVELLLGYLKSMGLKFVYHDDMYIIDAYTGEVKSSHIEDGYFIGTDEEKINYILHKKAFLEVYNGGYVGDIDFIESKIEEVYQRLKSEHEQKMISGN